MQRIIVGRALSNSMALGFCVLGALIAGPSHAEEAETQAVAADKKEPESYPHLSGELRAEIENNAMYSSISGSPTRKQNLIFNTFQPEFALEFNENLSLESEFTVEPIEDPENFDNQEFDREGVFIEKLFLN